MDIARSKTAAANLHKGRGTGHGVIDLRAAQPSISSAKVTRAAHHTPVAKPAAASPRHIAQFTDRFDRAKQFNRSPAINKFANSFGDATLETLEAPVHPLKAAASASPPISRPTALAPAMPRLTVTQHEAMTRLPATPPATPKATRPKAGRAKRRLFTPQTSRPLTVVAALLIMGGYVWVQNYPKLALQSASNAAGLVATLPGYLPSSYNLAKTQTSPGLVSLKFTSPSIGEILQINQHRTSWDSSSLLDNFVTKQTDDYSTVHGQGLTIYLFGQNQAAWVNHGIWYNIEGAARLSREQILKIAYSL